MNDKNKDRMTSQSRSKFEFWQASRGSVPFQTARFGPFSERVSLCCPQAGGEEVSGEQLHEILKEIDTNMNGQVELDEYLQVHIQLKLVFCTLEHCFLSFDFFFIHKVILLSYYQGCAGMSMNLY